MSNFSFLRGASHPEELLGRALALGYAGLALTDECSFAGAARAHIALRNARATIPAANHFRLLHGTEIRLANGPLLVLLAQNRTGYGNLSELVTRARRAAGKGRYHIDRAVFDANEPLLRDTLALLIAEPAHGIPSQDACDAAALQRDAAWLRERFEDRAGIACELLRGPDDTRRLRTLQSLARHYGMPLAAAGGVHMHVRSRKKLQDAVTAIRHGIPLSRCGTRLFPNAEQHLRSRARLARIYPPGLLAQSVAIAQRCAFSLDELRYEYPDELVPAGETPATHLRRLTREGAAGRYPQGIPRSVQGQIDHELALIGDLQYEPYFLTVHDIVRFARGRGILCQGRGSAANSAVCYCLGITEVDPACSNLLFERFLSRERNEPPDIDVDFENRRREEVMQYVFAKYGRERTALAAAVHTYRARSAVRDLGAALGLPAERIERLAESASLRFREHGLASDEATERPRSAGESPRADAAADCTPSEDFDHPAREPLAELLPQLIGFPRHLSQHTGGFVIARDRLSRLVPIENAAMPGRTVIQWDKDDLDALGLLKVDVLALGMLSCLRRAFDLINAFERRAPSPPIPPYADEALSRPAALTLANIPREDPAVYEMLSRGDSLGVFQVESRAQMSMLPRLRPQCFYDLVIQTAIVRPGPIQGGMVHPYLRRRQGLEDVSYPSPAVKAVLERTLGVPIFQEQVMQLAIVAAGFTPGGADQLRRAMASWKRKGGIGPLREKLVSGMLARGYGDEYAERIVRQIEGFGEYGFPESHAASFAWLVYVSAWIKCHYPAAFCAALLDSQPMGFYAPAQIVRSAVDHGVRVRPACVAASDWTCALEPHEGDTGTPCVRLGLSRIRGLAQETAQRIVMARMQAPFRNLTELARRAQLSCADLERLAHADALRSLAGDRRTALWGALGVDPQAPRQAPLAADPPAHESAPALGAPTEEQDILADYRRTGLSLRRHPLALLRPALQTMRVSSASEIARARDRQLVRASGIVICRQRPSTAKGVTFVTLEDETGTVNIVVQRTVSERFERELLESTLLTVYGQRDSGGPVPHMIAARLVNHSHLLNGLIGKSHDFH